MKILIFLHFLSHLFSLAQYEYFIEIMIIPCTHLFNHAAPWIHPFTPTPAFTKILRCNQSCQIAQCLKQAADYCCHCKLNYTITGFYEVFVFLADTNTKSWLSDSEKGNNAHFCDTFIPGQNSNINLWKTSLYRAHFRVSFGFLNCQIVQTAALSVAPSSSYHSQQRRWSWWG